MINLSLKYPAVKNRTIHSELINLIYMQRFSFYNFWSIFFWEFSYVWKHMKIISSHKS